MWEVIEKNYEKYPKPIHTPSRYFPKNFKWISKGYEIYEMANKDIRNYDFILNNISAIEYYKFQLMNAIDRLCYNLNEEFKNPKPDNGVKNDYE